MLSFFDVFVCLWKKHVLGKHRGKRYDIHAEWQFLANLKNQHNNEKRWIKEWHGFIHKLKYNTRLHSKLYSLRITRYIRSTFIPNSSLTNLELEGIDGRFPECYFTIQSSESGACWIAVLTTKKCCQPIDWSRLRVNHFVRFQLLS